MSEEIVYVRLLTGEEVLGKKVETSAWNAGRDVTLTDVVQMVPTDRGVSFGDFVSYTDAHERVTLRDGCIVFTAAPKPQLVNAYRQFTSGLVLPPSGVAQ